MIFHFFNHKKKHKQETNRLSAARHAAIPDQSRRAPILPERSARSAFGTHGWKMALTGSNVQFMQRIQKRIGIPWYNPLQLNSIWANKGFERKFVKTCCYIQFVLVVAFPAFILKCQPSNRGAPWSPKPNHHNYHTNRTRRSRQLPLPIPSCWWHALATSELLKSVETSK